MKTNTSGRLGEHIAACFLALQGASVLARRYRTRAGEIDIVAWDGRRVLFVEVKYRGRHALDAPASAVDRRKRRRILAAARSYLREHGASGEPVRFDVIDVRMQASGLDLSVRHIPAAFGAGR